MRSLLLCLLFACATRPPAPPVGEPVVVAEPPASGLLEGRRFVARSALMLIANRPGRNCAWGGRCYITGGQTSFIRVYERRVTCRDVVLGDNHGKPEVPLAVDERTVFIHLEGSWPLRPDTLRMTRFDGPSEQTYFSFERGFHSASAMEGTMRVLAASPTGGVIRLDVARQNLVDRDTLTGSIDFAVCP